MGGRDRPAFWIVGFRSFVARSYSGGARLVAGKKAPCSCALVIGVGEAVKAERLMVGYHGRAPPCRIHAVSGRRRVFVSPGW